MLLNIGGGVEVDLATTQEIAAQNTQLAELVKSNRPRPPGRPIYTRRASTGVTNAAGTGELLLGRPQGGRMWNVLAVVILGADDHTVSAGSSAALYVGDPQAVGLPDLVVPGNAVGAGTTLPLYYDLTEKVVWVNPSEELYVMVYNGGNAAPISAVAMVADYPQSAVLPDQL